MKSKYHSIVIGGGALGCASAISIKRKYGSSKDVLLLEKSTLLSGVSSDHSGIFRAVNNNPLSMLMAKKAATLWDNLNDIWGFSISKEKNGAIWISPKHELSKWENIFSSAKQYGIALSQADENTVNYLTRNQININDDELYFFEPDAFQFKPEDLNIALKTSLRINDVEVMENTNVRKVDIDEMGTVRGVFTDSGYIECSNLINAAGPWASKLLENNNINLPIRMEPVFICDCEVDRIDDLVSMPMIADYSNQIYFRSWGKDILHMHQPRSRTEVNINSRFEHQDALSSHVNYQNYTQWPKLSTYNMMKKYREKSLSRFTNLEEIQLLSGKTRYFDITPDHQYVLGEDSTVKNLYHCIGGGQSIKYAPLFGEMLAEKISNKFCNYNDINLEEYSIERFNDNNRKYTYSIINTGS